MNTWKLEETQIDPLQMRKQESLFAQGNGYLGWRGTLEEGGMPDSLEGTYINGLYETYPIHYPETAYGYPAEGQTMLNLMNAKEIRILIDDEEVNMSSSHISQYHRELDFRTGLLTRSFAVETKAGQLVNIRFRRFISFPRQHVGCVDCHVASVGFQGEVRLVSTLHTHSQNQSAAQDPRVGAHLPQQCFSLMETKNELDETYAKQRTLRSRLDVACAVRHVACANAAQTMFTQDDALAHTFLFSLQPGESAGLAKYVAYAAQTMPQEQDVLELARNQVRQAATLSFDALLQENVDFLKAYWDASDVVIQGDDTLQQGLRFNSFHILQSVGRDGWRSIGAKGLSGEGYEGHVFWDTEMFVLPSLLYSNPAICRSLLAYRYHGLPAARARAKEMGHPKGALFPWRTIAGGECSTFFPAGTAQYHIDGDIALAIQNYVQASGDEGFLEEMGAELLFEIARLWMSLGHFSPQKGGQFCIDCVTGPDEYTAIVDNNFYTNRIARESLWYAHAIYEKLAKTKSEWLHGLCAKLSLSCDEPAAWKDAGDRMYFPYDAHLGVHLQDDTFAHKADWDFAGTPKDQYPLLLHFHPLVIYRHKVLKQADVVLADLLFDQYIDAAQIQRDFDYYEPLTTHDSSLSACTHSMVACRIGDLEKAYAYFMRTARADLDDWKGNTQDGLHIANMAGTAMCLLWGFAGIRQWNGRLSMRPAISPHWTSYAFRVLFQGRKLAVYIDPQNIQIELLEGASLSVTVWEQEVTLVKGTPVCLPLP